MSEYSYPTGRVRTEVIGIEFTATLTEATYFYVPFNSTVKFAGTGRIGSYTINGSGSGSIKLTIISNEVCYVGDTGTLRYDYTPVSSTLALANVTKISGATTPSNRATLFTAIKDVAAKAANIPNSTDYVYGSGDCSADISFTYVWTINGVSINIPVYATSAAGLGCSASGMNCHAVTSQATSTGADLTANFVRFGNLSVLGSPGTYSIQSDVGTAFTPRSDINLIVQNRYIRGGTIPSSEYASGANVLFDGSGNVLGSLLASESIGAIFSCGKDSVYATVYSGSGSVSDENKNLNDFYGYNNCWFSFSFIVSQAATGAKSYASTTPLKASAALNPGLTVYASVPGVVSGYAVTIASVPTKTITGTWATATGGYQFTPAAGYTICGYRWLTVSISSAAGARVTIAGITKDLGAGETKTFTIDRYSDSACLVLTPASLGSPAVSVTVVSGTITPGTVQGTHVNPQGGNITGAAIYFSRTNSLPTGVSSEGQPHTLGMFTMFSGGCPGLRLDDMSLSSLVSFFSTNVATGITLTLSSGSLTPTAGTREAAFYNAGLALSCLNRGLPFFQALDTTPFVATLCRNIQSVTFDQFAGDVIGTGDFGQTIPITLANVCPTAFFVTLQDGLADTYTLDIRDATGTTVHYSATMNADSFASLVPDSAIPFMKGVGSTAQVNVIANPEIHSLDNRNSGAFYPV